MVTWKHSVGAGLCNMPKVDFGAVQICRELAVDPALGLNVGLELDLKLLSLPGLYILVAPSVDAALARFARFVRLVHGFEMRIARTAALCEVTIYCQEPQARSCAFDAVDFQLCRLLAFIRAGTQKPVSPRYLKLRRPKPDFENLYGERFGCNVSFSDSANVIAFHAEDFFCPQVTYNPVLEPFLARAVDEALRDMQDATMAGKVRRFLAECSDLARVSLAGVALDLVVGERTLQRRLLEEGHRFSLLLDAERHKRTVHLLRHSEASCDVRQLALNLGYRNGASFYRAFKRWTGMPLDQFRTLSIA